MSYSNVERHTLRLAGVAVLLTLLAVSSAFRQVPVAQHPGAGENLYKQHCARCHGNDGTKGMFGARDLQRSTLADTAVTLQIQRGKGFMPGFRKKLSPAQLQELVTYVKSLRVQP
ncbi:c-type cytochrome [Fulvivirgaceae bacterium PWU5]|uniref:C-type cytochrome n=1 Tax=Dawidia cretensis TaxID=2782350 RepID=A0AAP2DUG5_9BACT|nr:cytochrome c [Dawidia cretensis]MBT1706629.1 c-type cytochrome [Dawidia cretensis]